MKRLACYIFCINVIWCFGILSKELSEEDAVKLSSLTFQQAKKLLEEKRGEGLNAMADGGSEQQEGGSHGLSEEMIYWYGKNPYVREHYETFFSNTPHTLATGRKRTRVFNELTSLRSEWLVRLMIKEVMIDRSGQEFDNSPDPPLTIEEKVDLVNRGASKVFRNDKRAASYLLRLQLRGMPSLMGGGYPPKGYLETMRKWCVKNEKQIAELLIEKWGDEIALNKDMPNYRQKAGVRKKARTPDRLDAKSAKKLEDSRKIREGDDDFRLVLGRWIKWVLIAVFFLVLGCVVLKKSKAKA